MGVRGKAQDTGMVGSVCWGKVMVGFGLQGWAIQAHNNTITIIIQGWWGSLGSLGSSALFSSSRRDWGYKNARSHNACAMQGMLLGHGEGESPCFCSRTRGRPSTSPQSLPKIKDRGLTRGRGRRKGMPLSSHREFSLPPCFWLYPLPLPLPAPKASQPQPPSLSPPKGR